VSAVQSVNGLTGETQQLPAYPNGPVFMNCLVEINSTTLMSTGGSSLLNSTDGMIGNNRTTETAFYDSANKKWTRGPRLNVPRHGHSCATMNFKNPTTGQAEKVRLG
jgi:hypothetical protein